MAQIFGFSLCHGQIAIKTDGNIMVGDNSMNPAEIMEIKGNIELSSPEDGGTLVQNRNYAIYGIGGRKRLTFSSNASTQTS